MKLPEILLHLLYPRRCPVCDRPLRREEALCPDCEQARLSFTGGVRCDVCGLRLKDCICGERLYYEKAVFPFYYEGSVRKTVQKLKFHGRLDLVKPFAEEILRAARQREILSDADVICYIPMYPKRQRNRGYNQAQELAAELGKQANLPVEPLLYKMTDTEIQHDLPLSRRRGNVIGVFEPTPEFEASIAGKTVLLADDILTSGNTLNEAAKTLLIFGAEKVYGLCNSAAKKKKKQNGSK